MAINNEAIGIAAEVAIAKTFDVEINQQYVCRADADIVEFILNENCLKTIFRNENIAKPIKHIAEKQNPVDFKLDNGQTLSVKTNQNSIGKVAPQNIGQPTSSTYFDFIKINKIIPNFELNKFLIKIEKDDTYENRSNIFKCLSINYIDRLINMYWKNMFDCDYLILFFNLDKKMNPLKNYKVFGKSSKLPQWDIKEFFFTQTIDTWNESNTLKYKNISIGEFQVHRNRDCFKFRFNMKGILKLIESNLI